MAKNLESFSAEPQYFYLRCVSVPGVPPSKYTGRYVRYTMGGFHDVVLTPEPPKFIKFFSRDGQVLATHNGRTWEFVMREVEADKPAGCEPLQMFENEGTAGFYYDADGTDDEVLNWRSADASGRRSEGGTWSGWVLRDNPPDAFKGNPQLYWMAPECAGTLPGGCERVNLVREFVGVIVATSSSTNAIMTL